MSLLNFASAAGLLLAAFIWQVTLSGIQGRIVARVQKRVGPRWYQSFMDIFKAMSKRSISHGWVYDFGVIMALGGIMATLIFMPIAGFTSFSGMDNFFVITYLLAVGMLGMAMSAVGSGNPWASIGVSRALIQMVAYEVPFIIVVFAMIFGFKTASLTGLAAIQQSGGVLGWNLIRLPLGAIVGFISLMGMLGKKPFDTFIAPAEIASGPLVEYAGKHLGMLMVMHEFTTVVEVSLFTNLFLGGGVTLLGFLAKYFVVYTIINLISAVVGRLKIDQVVLFFYKIPIALALVQAVVVIFTGFGVTTWF